MGSVNVTDCITNLPLYEYDPTVMFMIVKTFWHMNIGAEQHWVPLTFPIFGEYNDYCGLEDIEENETTKFMLPYLQKAINGETRHFKIDVKEYKYYDEVYTADSIKGIFEMALRTHRPVCQYEFLHDKYTLPIHFVYMHRNTYDFLLELEADKKEELRDKVFYQFSDEWVGRKPFEKEFIATDVFQCLGDDHRMFLNHLYDYDSELFLSEAFKNAIFDHVRLNWAMERVRRTWHPTFNTQGWIDNPDIKLARFVYKEALKKWYNND